jgi:hypothetical protein
MGQVWLLLVHTDVAYVVVPKGSNALNPSGNYMYHLI